MANPLYKALNSKPQNSNNPQGMDIMGFMNQVRGMSPRDLINRAVSSGAINQDQLNVIQEKAKQMSSQFDKYRGMFGF